MARMLERYRNVVVPEMKKKFSLQSAMQVPRLEKIVINMGVGKAHEDIKILEEAMAELAAITGQKPVMTRARKAISNFKIRQGMPVGCKVTLRRTVMYEFFDRLVNIALPRIRDFRGVPANSFDEGGNYTLGIAEQAIFPEITVDRIKHVQGMDIIVVTTAPNKEQAKELLSLLGMPFRS
ncbi:MAG: 50S ribosomal protein L5 [Candidatus Omnitrophica bacterium]|nr:50S ribosomal protein L5 [Candidatus Omnitrophota bacterium]